VSRAARLRPAAIASWLTWCAVVGGINFGLMELTYSTASIGVVSPLFPAAGFAVAALWIGGARLWPAIFVSATAAVWLLDDSFWASVTSGGIATVAEPVVAVWLLRRLAFRRALNRPRDIGALAITAVTAPVAGATLGIGSLLASGSGLDDPARLGWFWWLADASAIIVLAPVVFLLEGRSLPRLDRRRLAEAAAVVACSAAIAGVALLLSKADGFLLLYLIFPLVVAAALRLGQRTVTVLTAVVAVIAVVHVVQRTADDRRLFTDLTLIDGFLAVLTLTGLLLASIESCRRQAEDDREASEQLVRNDARRFATLVSAQAALDEGRHDVDEVMARAAAHAQALAAADGAGVLLVEGDELVPRVATGIGSAVDRIPLDYALSASCVLDGEPVLHEDVADDPRARRVREVAARSFLAVPIHQGGRVVGVLAVLAHRPAAFGRRELETLQLVAGILAAAITNTSEFVARQTLGTILASSRDAIVGMALDGTITSWNAGATETYGYEPAEVIGRNVALLMPDDGADDPAEFVRRVRAGEATRAFESVRLAKNGRRVAVSVSIAPVKDAAGKPIGASSIARDITAAKALEDQLRQAQKMEAVGQLAGGIAHDFNNLLTVIIGHCDFALAEPGADTRDDIRRAKDAAERAAALTAQLLAFSRREEVEARILDVNSVISETEGLLGRVLGAHNRIELSLDPALGRVLADGIQLEQILLNLATNARDAMPHGGTLTIATSNIRLGDEAARQLDLGGGEYVLIRVADTGSGIEERLRERIFEPFFTTKEQGSGTGLGLSTVYGIVKQSAGAIVVESKVGVGTTFAIYLPKAEEPDPSGELPGVPFPSLST
jgi:PAS domain S-box-containing protein